MFLQNQIMLLDPPHTPPRFPSMKVVVGLGILTFPQRPRGLRSSRQTKTGRRRREAALGAVYSPHEVDVDVRLQLVWMISHQASFFSGEFDAMQCSVVRLEILAVDGDGVQTGA
jgi:hypothetical protein